TRIPGMSVISSCMLLFSWFAAPSKGRSILLSVCQMNLGEQAQVYRAKVFWPKLDQPGAQGVRLADQPGYFHSLAARRKCFQVGGAALQFDDCAAIVAAQQVITAHPYLKDSFIEGADGAPLEVPEALQGFMALKVFALIKLLDAMQEFWRRGFLAGRGDG